MNSSLFAFKKNATTIVAEASINMASNPGRNMGPALTSIISLDSSDYIEFWGNPNDAVGSPTFKANSVFGAAGSGNEFGGWRIV